MKKIGQLLPDTVKTHTRAKSYFEPGSEEAAENECQRYNHISGSLTGYDCEKCKNKGVTYKPRHNEYYGYWETIAVPCTCMGIRYELQRIEKSGLQKLLEKYTFDNFKTYEPWQNHILTEAHKYANSLSGWFYIGGQPGSGKTHICTAVSNQLLRSGRAVVYMIWNEEITSLKQNIKDADIYTAMIDRFKTADVLYIDDFFKCGKGSGVTAADVTATFKIINYRYNNDLPTLISSEFSIGQITAIDEALGSRIAEKAANSKIYIAPDKLKNFRLRNRGGV